jgi:hypothetical protein
MKNNLVDLNKLVSLKTFGKMKGVSRQRVHILVQQNKLDYVEIDGMKFINLTQKTNNYRK